MVQGLPVALAQGLPVALAHGLPPPQTTVARPPVLPLLALLLVVAAAEADE